MDGSQKIDEQVLRVIQDEALERQARVAGTEWPEEPGRVRRWWHRLLTGEG